MSELRVLLKPFRSASCWLSVEQLPLGAEEELFASLKNRKDFPLVPTAAPAERRDGSCNRPDRQLSSAH